MAKDKQAQTDPAASEATEVAENQAPPNDNNAVGETAEVPEGGGQSGPRAETDEAKGHIEPGLHGPYEPTELELMLARLKTGEEVTAEKLKVFKNAELVDMASKIGTKVNKKAKKADIITAITSKIPATDKGDDDAGAKAEDGKPAGDTDAGEGAKYPYAKSADVPAGTAYCVQCSTQLNPDGEGNLPSPCPGGCGTAIQDVTPHEGHYIGHPVGAKPEICSACGADLTGKADEDDTEGEEAKE